MPNLIKLNKKYPNYYRQLLIIVLVFLSCFIVLMTVAAFQDYNLDNLLYKTFGGKTGYFAYFFQIVCYLPLYLVPSFFIMVLSFNGKNVFYKSSGVLVSFLIVYIELYSIFYYLVGNDTSNIPTWDVWQAYVGGMITSTIYTILQYFIVKKFNEETIKTLSKFSIIVFISIVLEVGSVFLLKDSFPRARYNDHLNEINAGDTSWFQPWYSLNYHFQNAAADPYGNTSFPSAHMAAANSLYFLLFLPFIFPKLNKKSNWTILSLLVVSVEGLCAMGRMAGGYHFLSDVTVSGSLGFALFVFFFIIFYQINNNINFFKNQYLNGNGYAWKIALIVFALGFFLVCPYYF